MNSTTVGWTSEPEGRGTLGLLWSCFATMFLCTWSAVHPNVPGLKDSKQTVFWRRVRHVGICLLVPEGFAVDALYKLASARRLQLKVHRVLPTRDISLTLPTTPNWSLKRCFFLVMGGFVVEYKVDGHKHHKRVHPESLFDIIDYDSTIWTDIKDSEIDNRSKADWLVKFVALVQITYFIAQAIGRAAQGLAMTTLELFTLGVVLWALMIYGALWAMPFDVQHPILVTIPETDDINPISNYSSTFRRVELWDTFHMSGTDETWCVAIGAIVSLGFSALHLVAWRFHFLSSAEMWLWRVSSILCAIVPWFYTFHIWWDPSDHSTGDRVMMVVTTTLFGVYMTCRLYMFVEMFVGLRGVPPSVYQTPQWSQYFPSIS
jgi:hypothetical protein